MHYPTGSEVHTMVFITSVVDLNGYICMVSRFKKTSYRIVLRPSYVVIVLQKPHPLRDLGVIPQSCNSYN